LSRFAGVVVIIVLAGALASAANANFHVRAFAQVLPAKPSLASGSTNVRQAYRVGKGIYCVQPAPSIDWTTLTPLVAPLVPRSARGGSLLASYDAGGQKCPAAAIQVRTFRLHGARPTPADDVAFQLVLG
jgi:hypothetical protein